MRKELSWAIAAAAVAAGGEARAQTAPVVVYHGFVTNTRGEPVTASYTLKFSFFDAAVNGTERWTETVDASVEDGNLAVPLGATEPLAPSLFAGGPLYLAMSVGGEELPGRQQVGAAPLALHARDTAALVGKNVALTGCDPGDVLTFQTSAWECRPPDPALTALPGGGLTISSGAVSLSPCQQDEIPKYDGSAWQCGLDESSPGYIAGGGLELFGGTEFRIAPCALDEVLKWNGSTWACAADELGTQTTYLSGAGIQIGGTSISLADCSSGLILKSGGPGLWSCAQDIVGTGSGTVTPGAGIDITTGVISLAPCPNGEIWKSTGSSWGCAADAAGPTAGTGLQPSGSMLQIDESYVATLGTNQPVSGKKTFGDGKLEVASGAGGTSTFFSSASSGHLVNLPNADGTVAVSASSPLALNGTTGGLSLGTVGVANGGTGVSSVAAGELLIGQGSAALAKLGIGTTGQTLQVSGGFPIWGAANGHDHVGANWSSSLSTTFGLVNDAVPGVALATLASGNSTASTAVLAQSTKGTGVDATGGDKGVKGVATGNTGIGVDGQGNVNGVHGVSNFDVNSVGVKGDSAGGAGVIGFSGGPAGVLGQSVASSGGAGVRGIVVNPSATNYGVYGQAPSPGFGLFTPGDAAVQGVLFLGPSGTPTLAAMATPEPKLMVLRVLVPSAGGGNICPAALGMSCAYTPTGQYTLTYSPAFQTGAIPTVIASPSGLPPVFVSVQTSTATGAVLRAYAQSGAPFDAAIHVVVIGPR